MIPGFSPVSPISTIGGFAFVLGVTCVKDAYEDYQRYIADSEANNLPVQVLRDGVFEPTASMSLLVGDIILVKKDEPFPADLAIISCSDAEDICYIETSNLDGERNLKRAYPLVSKALILLLCAVFIIVNLLGTYQSIQGRGRNRQTAQLPPAGK